MFSDKDVMRFVEENDVKFVRLAFCDLLGIVKNVSIIASELPTAFKKGVHIDARAIDGFSLMGEEDLILMPDPSTVSMLPWRPRASGVIRLFCDIKKPDGSPFAGDGRRLLENAAKELKDLGISCVIGTDCQFYLFETDDKGRPTDIALDNAEYLDVAPLDKGEDIRRDICLTLDSLGMEPTTSHHEKGPGQNEIDFKHSEAISAADNFLIFKLLVKAISARNGVYATFTPYPVENQPANWLNLDFRLAGAATEEKDRFFAGIKNRLADMAVFLHPTVNACDVGTTATAEGADGELKIKGIDPTCNPYPVLALLISAGVEGVKNKETVVDRQIAASNYHSRVSAAEKSDFIKRYLPDAMVKSYIDRVKALRQGYESAADKTEYIRKTYFIKM